MFLPKAPPQLSCQKKKLSKGGRFVFFFFSPTILWIFQGWLSVNFMKITMMRIDSLWTCCFTETTFQKWGGFSGVSSLRQECVSFQTLGKKFSHVKKTATNYGGSVKALMKGGDLLIESCGCALFPQNQAACALHTHPARHSHSRRFCGSCHSRRAACFTPSSRHEHCFWRMHIWNVISW